MSTFFSLEHEFPKISLEKFESHLNHPKLNEMLQGVLGFDERKLLKVLEKNQNEIEWHFLLTKNTIPVAIKNILKEDTLSFVEISKFIKNEHCIYWKMEPKLKNLKVSSEGRWKLIKHGNGTKRIIEGTVTVQIPILGKVVESFVVSELKKSYQHEPKIQDEFYSKIQ